MGLQLKSNCHRIQGCFYSKAVDKEQYETSHRTYMLLTMEYCLIVRQKDLLLDIVSEERNSQVAVQRVFFVRQDKDPSA